MEPELEATILEMVSKDPNGITTERICRFTHRTPQELGDVFERLLERQDVLGFAGLWMSRDAYSVGANRLTEALRELHLVYPKDSEIESVRAVNAANLKWDGKPLERILTKLEAEGRIQMSSKGISLSDFILELTPRQRTLMDRVIEAIEKHQISTPTPQELAQTLGIPRQAVEEILRLGVRSGEVIQIADVVYYTPSQIEEIKAQISEFAQGKPFASNDVRDAFHSTRKYILPILDYLDGIGFTVKRGTHRVIL